MQRIYGKNTCVIVSDMAAVSFMQVVGKLYLIYFHYG